MKRLIGLTLAVVMAMLCTPVLAENVQSMPDEVAYYQNGSEVESGEITAGELTAKVVVVNKSSDEQTVQFILATYDDEKLLSDVSYIEEKLQGNKNGVLESEAVTVPEGGTARAFVWRNMNPVKGLNDLEMFHPQEAKLLSADFKKSDSDAAIAECILDDVVYVNSENLDGLTADCKVSAGCEYDFDSAENKITVTSADGKSKTYTVVANPFFYDGFSSYDKDDVISTASSMYANATNGTNKAWVQEENGNKYLELYTVEQGQLQPNLTLPADYKPSRSFVVDFDIRYRASEDGSLPASASTQIRTASGYFMGHNVFAKETDTSGLELYHMKAGTTGINDPGQLQNSGEFLKLDQWYNMKYVYTINSDSEVTKQYYLDNKLIGTVEDDASGMGQFEIFGMRGTTLKGSVDYDNIKIVPLSEAQLLSVGFEKNGAAVASCILEDTVYVNSENLDGLTADCKVPAGCAYAFNSETNQITVTSVDGRSKTYNVVANPFFYDDFSSYDKDAVISTANSMYEKVENATNGNNKVWVQEENGNKYLELYTVESKQLQPNLTLPASYKPSSSFIVDFDIRYRAGAGGTLPASASTQIRTTGGYFMGHNVFAKGSDKTGLELYHMKAGTAGINDPSKTQDSGEFLMLNQWYNVKYVYTINSDSEVTKQYYLNNRLVGTVTDNKAGMGAFTILGLRGTTNKEGSVDYDNIKVIPLNN